MFLLSFKFRLWYHTHENFSSFADALNRWCQGFIHNAFVMRARMYEDESPELFQDELNLASRKNIVFHTVEVYNADTVTMRVHLPLYMELERNEVQKITLRQGVVVARFEELLRQYEREQIGHGIDVWLDDEKYINKFVNW